MAFKMKGYSAFTKKEEKEYEPQTKAGGREYEDKVRRSDLDEEGKKIFDSKEYEPQSKTFVGDMIPQTELNKMDLEDLEMERENIFNNAYEDAKADNNTSTIKLLEGRMGKLDKLIDEKIKNK